MRPIIFTDYDKLTDVVYSLGSKTVLELVVSLSRKMIPPLIDTIFTKSLNIQVNMHRVEKCVP